MVSLFKDGILAPRLKESTISFDDIEERVFRGCYAYSWPQKD